MPSKKLKLPFTASPRSTEVHFAAAPVEAASGSPMCLHSPEGPNAQVLRFAGPSSISLMDFGIRTASIGSLDLPCMGPKSLEHTRPNPVSIAQVAMFYIPHSLLLALWSFPYLTPKSICKIMALWAAFRGFGLLFYVLTGSR